jgi:hypothetical protein
MNKKLETLKQRRIELLNELNAIEREIAITNSDESYLSLAMNDGFITPYTIFLPKNLGDDIYFNEAMLDEMIVRYVIGDSQADLIKHVYVPEKGEGNA